jgi:hypothetical protein
VYLCSRVSSRTAISACSAHSRVAQPCCGVQAIGERQIPRSRPSHHALPSGHAVADAIEDQRAGAQRYLFDHGPDGTG